MLLHPTSRKITINFHIDIRMSRPDIRKFISAANTNY